MATAETALVARLLATPSVTAIIGNRVYSDRIPQSSVQPPLAVIVFQRIDTPRLRDLSGPRGYAYPRFQLDCYAANNAVVLALAKAVRLALDGYRGTSAQLRVSDMNVETEASSFDDDVKMFRRRLDIILSHYE